jgi:hypothetical protein
VLYYWNRVKSNEASCDADLAHLLVNDVTASNFALCASATTTDWQPRTLDLGSYAGQSIVLKFRVQTNATTASSLFLDDFAFKAK